MISSHFSLQHLLPNRNISLSKVLSKGPIYILTILASSHSLCIISLSSLITDTILCSLGTNSPIVFNARISKSKYREEATIINAVNTADVQGMMYVENKANIYYASTLNRGEVNYNASSQITEITIRFNLKGALSGPLPKNEEDYDDD